MLTRPQTAPDFYETLEDTPLIVEAVSGVLANDRDPDGAALTAVPQIPALGTWTLQLDGSFSYLPPPDFEGLDLAGYLADDGTERSFQTLVQFHVLPVNDPPESYPDRFFTLADQPLNVSSEMGVLVNDVDADDDPLSVNLIDAPLHGQLTLNPDGSFRYEPNVGFEGEDGFNYRAADGAEAGNVTAVTIHVTSQPIIISELMASNANTLETRTRPSANTPFRGDPDSPDWIELHNLLAQPIELGGMHLTDDKGDPNKWQFPADTVLPANGDLVVFASGADVRDSSLDENGFLHTSFQLSNSGEYLALTSTDGRAIFEFADEYPEVMTDVSFGIRPGSLSETAYFVKPTPGAANEDPRDGIVNDAKFNVNRGFFDAPFQLQITTETPNAIIRYTTDGSRPSESDGQAYSGPINLDRTTTLRVAAYRDDLVPSPVETHTYFFLDDVLNQDRTPPTGFPATWGGTLTDWGLDQDPQDLAKIAGDENYSLGEAQQVIKDSLLSLPSISLVTTVADMFGDRNGIYAHTQGRGVRWERPVSVEYIDPDGSETGFQIDAGIRIQGFTSRDPNRNPKHSLRLVFRNDYGPPTLDYPLFGPDAARSFDTIVLRSNSQDAWVYDTTDNRQGQFVRDEWARQTQLAMGQPGAHGTWAHLYINGLYWGLYNPTERPDASFNASYVGGDAVDYDIVKNHEEVIDGNGDAYQDLLAAIQNNPRNFGAGYRDLSDNVAYQRLQGNDPDGTRSPQLPVLIDVPNLIDYIILGAYAAATDWPGNYYMGRDRTEESEGFKFFMWDNEHGMKPSVRTNRALPHSRDNDSPTKFYHALRANSEFRLLFADHLHRAFFNGGPLYVDPASPEWNPAHPERNVPAARWMELTTRIEQALIAEAARWGDVRGTQYTPHDQFQRLRDRLLQSWFTDRSEIVFDHFKRLGLYPEHAAPVFSQHGGQIPSQFGLEISNPNEDGQVFYTLDGSDPRTALSIYTEPISLSGRVTVKSRVLLDGEWSALNEASFSDASPAGRDHLRVSEINYNPAAPNAAELEMGFTDNDEFEFIELVNVSDVTIDLSNVALSQVNVAGELEGVSFDFSAHEITQLGPNEVVLVVENMDAFAFRYGNELPVAGQWQGKLSNDGETITVAAGDVLIQQFAYSDAWHPQTDGVGKTLESVAPSAADLAVWASSSGWRSSSVRGGSPGRVDLAHITGDSNHDGVFNSADLVLVFTAGEYEDAIPLNSTFEEGDWNLDGDFTSGDLVLAFQAGTYATNAETRKNDLAAAVDWLFRVGER